MNGDRSARRVTTRVGCAVLLAFAGILAWGWFAPLVSDDEVADATAESAHRRMLAGTLRCSRPTLGTAQPYTSVRERANAIAALGPCLEAARHEHVEDPVSRPLSVSADDGAPSSDASDETAEGQEAPEPGASDPQVEYWGLDYDEEAELVTEQGPFDVFLQPRHAPTPIGAEPPLVLAAQEACSPLEAVLARGAATANLCVGPAGLTADASMHSESLGVAKAAGLIARQRWSQGRQSDALSILENAFMVVRDYRRGAVSWISAMISVAAYPSVPLRVASRWSGRPLTGRS